MGREILKTNVHPHPLLYLQNVPHADLLAVLDFMYNGEVQIVQEDLVSFLAVAEELEVKGLMRNDHPEPRSHHMRDTKGETPPKPKKPRISDEEPSPSTSEDHAMLEMTASNEKVEEDYDEHGIEDASDFGDHNAWQIEDNGCE